MASHNNYKLKDGWITKGIRLIENDPKGFSEKDADMILGVSRPMADAIRYWMIATGILRSGHGGMKFTELGDLIRKKDKYLEEEVTLFLLHRNLIKTGKFKAAAEYFGSGPQEMTREELAEWLSGRIDEINSATASSDASMLIQTYAGIRTGDPEDNNYCPLSDLKLIKRDKSVIRKTMPNLRAFPKKLILLEMEELCGKEKGCSFEALSERTKEYYNLPCHVCYDMANSLAAGDYVTFVRTAGLDQIYKKDFPKDVLSYLFEDIKNS